MFFVLEVGDIERARGFVDAPEAKEVEQASRVIDGEYHSVEDSKGY